MKNLTKIAAILLASSLTFVACNRSLTGEEEELVVPVTDREVIVVEGKISAAEADQVEQKKLVLQLTEINENIIFVISGWGDMQNQIIRGAWSST